MTKKAFPVRRAIKPVKTKSIRTGKKKAAKSNSPQQAVDVKRQLKIQKALYEIADAASAVRDMQSFYRKLHKIVGKLMYAENFFIALYDDQTGIITWPYRVDTVDVDPLQPAPLSNQYGTTG